LCLLPLPLLPQSQPEARLCGQALEEVSRRPLAGARIRLLQGEEGPETLSDSLGRFRIDGLRPGRYRLRAEKEGFAAFEIPDLLLDASKDALVEALLREVVYEGEQVRIEAYARPRLQMNPAISVEETQRFAAAYFDPARVATAYPGVVQANDQANHLVIRGNSPNGMLWRLEGVDIVNPNHLSNAGTFSDRLSLNGGGAIILSTQLLGNSSLSTGAFEAQYGNALSGVFDINLRRGNNEHGEFTGQMSLIGLDLAAEGPLSRSRGSSFLVNYRYSFTGLLALMGIRFGGEAITFQDLSFNLSFPTRRAGHFTAFGIGGLSSNRFEAPRTADSLRSQQKDRFDINFASNMGAAGITHQLLLGERSLWRSVVAVSGIFGKREADYLADNNEDLLRVEEDYLDQAKLSLASSLKHKLSARSALTAGFFLTRTYARALSQRRPLPGTGRFELLADFDGSAWLLQPYLSWSWQPAPAWTVEAGLHGMFFFLNGSRSVEPRLSATWELSERQSLRLAYGLHSQLQPPTVYFTAFRGPADEVIRPNVNLGFTRAHHALLSWRWSLSPNLQWRVEPYFQHLFGVPVSTAPGSTFSALNLLEASVTDSLQNLGAGRNYGIESSLEQRLSRQYYFILSAALYESEYRAADGVWRDTRYNGRYAFSATGGKEIAWPGRKQKSRFVGINLRTVLAGGFREMPIDLEASRAAQRSIFDERNGFSEPLPGFFRADLRITFKRNRERYTRSFGIDIQNLSNRQNVAFRTYDFLLDEVVTKYQLGIIPLMNYRLEF
jgi:hypothetical protein